MTIQEVVAGAADTAGRALVFDREGLTRAFVAADYLSSRQVEVVLITALPEVGPLLDSHMRDELIQAPQPSAACAVRQVWRRWAGRRTSFGGSRCADQHGTDRRGRCTTATVGSTSESMLADELRDIYPSYMLSEMPTSRRR